MNQNVIYMCGHNGTILKSINAGLSWLQQPTNTLSILSSIYFINENTGVSVGNNGTILTTTNGGINWSINNYNNYYFRSCFMTTANKVFACGNGIIIYSSNGGATWQNVFIGNVILNSIQFPSESVGFSAGEGSALPYVGKIFKTTNGGLNWFNIDSSEGAYWTSLNFRNENSGFAGGYTQSPPPYGGAFLFKTSDGGNNFTLSFQKGRYRITDISFKNDYTGFATMYNGGISKIIKTTNAGITWDTNSLNTGQFVNSISSSINMDITAGVGGYISISTNSGINWYDYSNSFYDEVLDVSFKNANSGLLLTSTGKILRTTNSGINWSVSSSHLTVLYSFCMINDTGFVGGRDHIYKTTDYGNSLISVFESSNINVYSIHFFNNNTGIAGCNNGGILKTTNSGITWIEKNHYIFNSAYLGIFFKDTLTGWLCSWNGWLSRTTNGGDNWITFNPPLPKHYYDVYFTSKDTGYIAAQQNILKSTNGGQNWFSQYYVEQSSFKSIIFKNSLTGLCTGFDGSLMYTTNAGQNWINAKWPTSNMVNSIFMLDANSFVGVGMYGTVLKTTNGGIPIELNSISSQIPQFFSLHQNYPNPFNPVTKIQFDIPLRHLPLQGGDREGVILKIYDLLGREITTLVNEQLSPGTYSVDWDGTGFASGVYFYSLVTQDFVETKRMVLIK